MNSNNQSIADNEIDLREVILTLWKEKFFILIITLIFTVAGYIHGTLHSKVYENTITLRDAPAALFEKYSPFLQQQQQQQQISIATNFNNEFKLNLMSLDYLILFIEQNKKLDEFKSYLKTNNIDIKYYFQNKFQPITGVNIKPSQYSFTFSKPFPIEGFLSDYVNYVKQITEIEFRKQLKLIIKNEIQSYNQNLEIAKKINLENPILKSFAEGNYVVNEPNALFYKGSKVLSLQIIYYENLLNEIESLVFEYNPILESPTKPSLVSKSVIYLTTFMFILGLFFSFTYIYIKSLFLK